MKKKYYKNYSPKGFIPRHLFQLGVKPLWLLFSLPFKFLPARLLKKLTSTQRLLVNTLVVGTIVIFGIWIITSLLQAEQAKAAWFNSNWQYRVTIPVTNAGSMMTNAQIPIATDTATLITDGKMRSDCRDIRVTTQTGKILKHWIHQCNTATTRIYVIADLIPAGASSLFLYYGNNTAANNIEIRTGTNQYPGISCKTILDHGDSTGNGSYVIDPNAGQRNDAFSVSCDMTTDSGGWTIVNATNGTTSQQGLVSDTEVTGNPFSSESLNISLIKKRDIATTSAESLFKRSTVWLKANVALFDGNLTTLNQHTHNTNVTLTANDGTTVSTAVAGYSNYNISGGGDYGITTSVGFDHHSTNYYHLRSACANHYLYKYGTTYNVNTALGSWVQTASCSNNSTAMGAWYAAMRGTSSPIPAYLTISSPTNEERSEAPIAYWKLDEGQGSVAYDTTGKNNGSLQGSPVWKNNDSCIIGKCLQFNGSSHYVSVPNDSNLNPTTGLTIQAWVKPTSIASSTNYNIVAKQDWGNKLGYRLAITGYGCSTNCLFMGVGDGTNQTEAISSVNLNDLGNWHHVVGVYTSGSIKFYVDGVLRATSSTPVNAISNTSSLLAIARHSSGGEYFPGFIDDVRIYPYARTGSQIKTDYNARGSVKGTAVGVGGHRNSTLSNGLVGYWKQDESTANTCSGAVNDNCDSSGNNNDGAWNVNATASTSGKFGLSGIYDSSSYTQIAASSTLQITEELTVCSWVNTWMTTMNGGIFEKTSNGNVNTGYLLFAEGTNYKWRVYNGALTTITSTASLTSLQNRWAHICGTYSKKENGMLRLFVNGSQQAATLISGSTTLNSGSGVSYLGSLSGTYRYNGAIDEIRVYNRAMSSTEVLQLYNFAPGPKVHYAFDEPSGSVASDKSGENNQGTANNSPGIVPGQYGKARNFNGTGKNVAITSPVSGSIITATLWYKRDEQSASNTWRTLLADATANIHHLVSHSTSRNLGIWDGSFKDFGYTPPSDGKWHYYAIILQSAVNAKLYVDGTYRSTIATTLDLSTYPIGKIGNWNSGGYYAGPIDEVKIYNYSRSEKQIIEDMNAGHPIGGSPVGSQIIHLKMDEGYGTTANNSGNTPSLTGSINGPTWSTNGKYGKALNFDGSDDYVQITDNAALDLANEWTIGGWFRPDETTLAGSDRQVLISKWQTSAGTLINYYLYINTAGKAVGTVGNGSASQSVTSTTTLSPNNWYHLMATFNGTTGNLKIYVNGINEATTATGYTTAYTNTGNVRLGQYDFAWAAYRDEYNGLMDDIKIYGVELTADQVKIDMTHNASLVLGSTSTSDDGKTASNSADRAYCPPGDTTSTCSPIAEWEFDEKTGSTTNDTSGTGLAGTISGASWTQGKIGAGLNFDGADDYVSIGSSDALDITGNLSIEAWIYPTGWGESNYGRIFERYDGANGYRLFLAQDGSNNRLSFYANGQVYSTVGSISLNKWHHIVTTVSGTTVTFYINGTAHNGGSIVGIVSAPGTTAYIGNNSATDRSFKGKIDHVKIYNYAQSNSQALYNYNRGKPVASYKIDECQGSTLNDSSGNGLTGAITIGGSGTQTTVGTCQTASTAWGNGASGKFNYSLNFDGTDDYFEITQPNIPTSPNTFTVTGWIKPGAQDAFFVTPNSNGIDQWIGYDVDTHRLQVSVATSADTNQSSYYSTTNSVPESTWTHFAVTINDRDVKIYLNGKLNTTTTHGFDIGGWTGNWRIGQRGNSTFWYAGQMDELQIFSYVLTTTQIKNVMNQSGAVRFGPNTGTP